MVFHFGETSCRREIHRPGNLTYLFQAQDSARYGRTVLLLTVVTIIFLPMSFLATWFGMNIKDPDAGSLNLRQIAAIIFPISLLIALLALVLAFSERLRNLVLDGMEHMRDLVLEAMGANRAGSRDSRRKRQIRRRRRLLEEQQQQQEEEEEEEGLRDV